MNVRQFEQGQKVKVQTSTSDQCLAEILGINDEDESATIKVLKVVSGKFFRTGVPKSVSLSSLSHLLSSKKLVNLVKTQLLDVADLLTSHESVEFLSILEQEELAALKEKMTAAIRQSLSKKT